MTVFLKLYRELKKIEGINHKFVVEEIFSEKFEKLLAIKKIDNRKKRKFQRILNLLKKGERPEYIFKKAIFLDEEFYIEKGVLIPREETVEIVNYLKELNYQSFKPDKILDFGTGTGILAIWAKRIFPDSQVIAVDYSKRACKCALINSKNKKVRIKIIRAKNFKIFKQKFDLIITNPPYLSGEEYIKFGPFKGESKKALLGGKKGYETFLKWLKEGFKILKNKGLFVSEISSFWNKKILGEFEQYLVEEKKDFYGKKRVWIFEKT